MKILTVNNRPSFCCMEQHHNSMGTPHVTRGTRAPWGEGGLQVWGAVSTRRASKRAWLLDVRKRLKGVTRSLQRQLLGSSVAKTLAVALGSE